MPALAPCLQFGMTESHSRLPLTPSPGAPLGKCLDGENSSALQSSLSDVVVIVVL